MIDHKTFIERFGEKIRLKINNPAIKKHGIEYDDDYEEVRYYIHLDIGDRVLRCRVEEMGVLWWEGASITHLSKHIAKVAGLPAEEASQLLKDV